MKVVISLYLMCSSAMLVHAHCPSDDIVHISFDALLPETPYRKALSACVELHNFLKNKSRAHDALKVYWQDILLGKLVYAERTLQLLSDYIVQGGYCSAEHLAYLIRIGLSLDYETSGQHRDQAKHILVKSTFDNFMRNFAKIN